MIRSTSIGLILAIGLCLGTGCQLIYPISTADQSDMSSSQTVEVSDQSVQDDLEQMDQAQPIVTPDMDMSMDAGIDMSEQVTPFDPRSEPMQILFLGNSFTHQGPVPIYVRTLATQAGWPEPEVTYVAPGGKSLAYHRTNGESLNAVDRGGWHAVVLQDLSTRPTDNAGDPGAFKADALWFFERIQASSPGAHVVLYLTWARHPDHGIYPGTFASPDEMQDQLTFHYRDAVERFIPDGTMLSTERLKVAPVGEVWRHHLATPEPVRLHGDDDYHAGVNGRWLNALTIYATLYGRRVENLPVEELSFEARALLAASVDAVTGQEVVGGPDGMPFEPLLEPGALGVGDKILIDFGPADTRTDEPGWNNVAQETSRVEALVNQDDVPTYMAIETISSFSGSNVTGLRDNVFGYPESASNDSIWSGAFEGTHEEALMVNGEVRVSGLDPLGEYDVRIFASRRSEDTGFGRLGRYTLGGMVQDLDVTDNTSMRLTFSGVTPDADGSMSLSVNVSPDGGSRYSYLGVMEIERTK